MTAREDNFDRMVGQVQGINDALSPGEEGVRHDGVVFSVLRSIKNTVEGLAGQVLDMPIEYRGGVFPGQKTSLRAEIGWLPKNLGDIGSGINKILEALAGLTAAVKASSEKQGVDPATLEKLIAEAVAKSVGTYEMRKVEDK